jgi:5-formaminoimidazole-4-carboxamide-1-beta-D-ribofuranosyl 5'-monophosphate synthetase
MRNALNIIKTAKEAGFTVVGVYDAAESDNENEIKNLADIYISSYAEMGNYVN